MLAKHIIPISLIAILIASIGFQGLFAVAEEQGEDGKKKIAENLINSLKNAINVVRQIFDGLKAQDIEISEEAKRYYEQGVELAERAKELFNQEKYKDSAKVALVALRNLKIALIKAGQSAIGKEERALRLQVAANRTIEFTIRIEEVVKKAEENGYDVSKVKELIDEVKGKVENVTKLVLQEKFDEAAKELGMARKMVKSAIHELYKIVKPERIKQAKQFVKGLIRSLEARKRRIANLPVPDEVKQRILLAFEEAEKKLLEAGKELDMNGLHKAVAKLVLVSKVYRKIHNEINRIKKGLLNELAREVKRLERNVEKLEKRVSKAEDKNVNLDKIKEKIGEVKKLLEEVKEFVKNGDVEKALEKIKEIKQILNEIKEMLVKKGKKS
jgi:predicted phosphatase